MPLRVALATLAALALVAASVTLGLGHYRARPVEAAARDLVDEDPAVRAERGEKERALGVALSGYETLWVQAVREHDADGDGRLSLEESERIPAEERERAYGALRGRIRTSIMLGAVAINHPGVHLDPAGGDLEACVVGRAALAYLEFRRAIDPDGTFLRRTLDAWIHERLEFHKDYLEAHASAAIYLAALGDERAREKLLWYTREDKFYYFFFPWARRYLPPWETVRILLEVYLPHEDLDARVEAGVALLWYHALYGVGDALVERYLPSLREAFVEAAVKVRHQRGPGAFDVPGNALLGLAMIGGRREKEVLQGIRLVDAPYQVYKLRASWILSGLQPIDSFDVQSRSFRTMDPHLRDLYMRAVAFRYAEAARALMKEPEPGRREELEQERRRALEVLEVGLLLESPDIRILALEALHALSPEHARLPMELAGGDDQVAIYAACLLPPDIDRVPILLPALAIGHEPDFAAKAAAALLERDHR